MKNFFKNYKQTLILILSLILGAIAGLTFGEKTEIVKPLGDLFMNLMFVIIVPMIFLTITTSISQIKQPKRLGKVITTILVTFVITSLVAVVIGLISTYAIKLVDPNDEAAILSTLNTDTTESEIELNILERTINAISVSDFSLILSKNNILPLVIFSILFGLAMNKVGKDSKPLENVLKSTNKVILKIVDIVFLYAPIGLGCYFAALIGTFGSEIAIGYFKTFIVYLIVAILFYIVFYTLYAFIAGGKEGIIAFWKNVMPASATAISTCSSAASIPVNTDCVKKIGVSNDIAETIVPLGTSFHKDGSIIGSVFKIMFLAYLFGIDIYSIESIFKIVGVSLIANLLVMAVPVGGGTISEMMIISMMGFPPASLPILTIIATIIDPPATLLNVVGDTSASMLVARHVDGKDWLKQTKKVS